MQHASRNIQQGTRSYLAGSPAATNPSEQSWKGELEVLKIEWTKLRQWRREVRGCYIERETFVGSKLQRNWDTINKTATNCQLREPFVNHFGSLNHRNKAFNALNLIKRSSRVVICFAHFPALYGRESGWEGVLARGAVRSHVHERIFICACPSYFTKIL